MKRFILFLMIIFNIFALTACGDAQNNNSNDSQTDSKTEENNDESTKHTHKYDSEYVYDSENHWLECSCGEKKNKSEHIPLDNSSYEANICSECSAVYTAENYYENIKSIGVDPSQPHNAYQVLIYSYYDADNDGYGDLAGLESKLEYIKELGCDIIWLSPIMESESYHAYDITSFYKIDEKIGTIDDYLSLVDKAHSMDMKIVLDMPINHTSLNHEWFLEYLAGNDDYAEYYQEYDSSVSYGNSSSMGAKAKFYTDSETGKSYFAAFGSTMPDLNYQSEELVNAVYEVFDYWMALGTDGFRFDAVKHLFDPNEIPSYEDSITLNNEFFQNLGSHLKGINENVYLLGENFSGQGEVKLYAESFDAEFDFDSWQKGLGAVTMQNAWGGNDGRIYFDDTIVCNTNELIDINPNWIPTFMTGNHDVTRAASYICDKVADDQAALKLYAAMIMLRSGIPFIYYGDEVGMYGENKSGDYWVEDSQLRLPMNFNDSTIDLPTVFYTKIKNPTTGAVSTLGDNMLADWPNYATTNPVVEDQIADSDSIYNTYKDLIAFRTENPIISLGTMSQVADFKGKGSIIKFEYDAEVVYVAFNYSEGQVELTNLTDGVDLEILYNVNGAETDGSSLTLAGRGVAVFTTAGEISESSGKQTGTITVYFSAPASDWGNTAYCYLWNDDSKQSNANWPGIEMTFVKVNEYNQRIYTIDVDLDKYDMIIFNNNKGWQSKDTSLASAEDGMGFYLNGDNSLGTYTFS